MSESARERGCRQNTRQPTRRRVICGSHGALRKWRVVTDAGRLGPAEGLPVANFSLPRGTRTSRRVSRKMATQSFFELAVATAIVLFGFHSGAAMATVVGVLIEVPVMLAAVHVVNNTRDWYERRRGVTPHAKCCPWDVHPDHAR